MGQQLNVPVDQLPDRICRCGGTVFTPALCLKEIPAIYSASAQKETMMLNAGFICGKCGALMSLRPEETKPEQKLVVVGN